MIASVKSCALSGLDGYLVTAEVDAYAGVPAIDIVGLPDAAVKESRERVRSAVRNSGLQFPQKKLIINLAPADTKKEGAYLDLAIAVAILLSSEQLPAGCADGCLLIGELALDGSIRPVNGVLPMVLEAKKCGLSCAVVPQENAREAAVVDGVAVYGAAHLSDVAAHLRGDALLPRASVDLSAVFAAQDGCYEDFADVKGQEGAKRALEVAAAGAHNCLMIGAPGSGKTMLARRLPGILPDLTFDEALEVTKIYSIAGKLPPGEALIRQRPFRSPHHGISASALTAGGSNPRPGEICLAHRGVLFLDEFPEFRKDAMEAMRQPLEDGRFTVARAGGTVTYPSACMLVASMNPCRCGYYGDPVRECTCTPGQIQKYLGKISGPMLDRVDIHIEVPTVRFADLAQERKAEPSAAIKRRVDAAREIQLKRYQHDGIFANAQLDAAGLEQYCRIGADGRAVLAQAFERLGLSARAHARILKVARTIADLAGEADISVAHLAEAIQYRSLDKKFFR